MAQPGKVKDLSTFTRSRVRNEPTPGAGAATQPATESADQPAARAGRGATSKELYRRATYYLRPSQIKALKQRALDDDKELSELVREVIDRGLAT